MRLPTYSTRLHSSRQDTIKQTPFFGGTAKHSFFPPATHLQRKCEECAQEEKLQRMSQEEDEVQKKNVTEEEEEVQKKEAPEEEEEVKLKAAGTAN